MRVLINYLYEDPRIAFLMPLGGEYRLMEVYKLTGMREFYAFYVGKEHEIERLPKERHYLISKCAGDFIAFTSPKFTKDKSGNWLFCHLIKRLPHFMVLEREEQ